MGIALAQMIVETDLVGWIGTFFKGKEAVQEPLDFCCSARIRVGTKVESVLLLDLAGNEKTGIDFIANLDVGIGLVVLEPNVVLGLVFLNQVDFQKQSFCIGLGHDKLKILNFRN